MSQYGASCNPAANFPNPNSLSGTPSRPVRPRRPPHRQPRFFSPRLQRVSELLQDPRSIRLPELAALLWAAFALSQGALAGARVYDILARRDVGLVCAGASALQCLRFHLWLCVVVGSGWAASVLPWGVVAVFAVVVGEMVGRG